MQAFWRQGFAREAASAVIGHVSTNQLAKNLFAGHNPHNFKSKPLLLSLGFKLVREEFYPPTGLMHPSYELTLS